MVCAGLERAGAGRREICGWVVVAAVPRCGREESCGERAETVLFPRLEGIDFFESSWIRREGLETNKQADGDMGEPLPY